MYRVFEEITSYVCVVHLHVFIEHNKRDEILVNNILFVCDVMMLTLVELFKFSNFQAVTNE